MRPFDATLIERKGQGHRACATPRIHGRLRGHVEGVVRSEEHPRSPLTQRLAPRNSSSRRRLNQNLDFKAKFEMERINASVAAPAK